MKTRLQSLVFRSLRLGIDHLNKKTERLSTLKKKIALVLFCISFSCISTYIILEALVTKRSNSNVFIGPFSMPTHIGKTSDYRPSFTVRSSDSERVAIIKRYIDSLKYNDLTRSRPGLIDSIRTLEQFYLQNQKTK